MNNNLIKNILENEFSHLNKMQQEAVFHINGPLLILAGAGSGKTTVLINRILYILNFGNAYHNNNLIISNEQELILKKYYETKDISLKSDVAKILNKDFIKPYEILAITFTNKAAAELKERLLNAIGEVSTQIWAGTFHATCTKILRRYADRLGYSSNFTIYDEDDKKRVLTDIIRSLNLDDKKYDPRSISSAIGRAKDNLQNSNAYAKEASGNFYKETIASIYSQYEKIMFKNNALDFDDIISKTVLLLSNNDDVLEYYSNKFKYIVVDEYQDTNHAQYKLVYLLANAHKNICVVGDDDQSIYKFRGATITNILEFERDYDTAKTIRLEQNYRSTSCILNCANGLIKNNSKRKGKNLWTDKESDDKVKLHRVESQDDEARFIANSILDLVASGKSFSDVAILYRSHALSNSIENALKRNGVPYRIFSGLRFFDRAEVRDMLAYLWVINNSNDTLRLKRVINNPPRKIGGKTIEVLDEFAIKNDTSIYEVLRNIDTYADLSRASNSLKSFFNLIEDLKNDLNTLNLADFYDNVARKTGYVDMLLAKDNPESAGRLENVYELKSSIVEYMTRCEDTPTLSGFLEEISLFTDLDRDDLSNEAVTMMTIHSSKGLEFPCVFICGLEDGVFPSFKSLEDPLEIEEERRLAYVAITRAKEYLSITCAERRLLYGQTKYHKPSLFISEIPAEFLDSNISKSQMRITNNERSSLINSKNALKNNGSISISVSNKTSSEQDFNFKSGMQIEHKVFGNGLITNTKPMGGDLLLEIAFDNVGTKRLLAKSAGSFMKIKS